VGDGIAVAVPLICIMVVAVMLIQRGNRLARQRKMAAKAPWRMLVRPESYSMQVFLWQEGHRDDERILVGSVDTTSYDWEETLMELKAKAESEALHLNMDL
jgi:hypothetical protein